MVALLPLSAVSSPVDDAGSEAGGSSAGIVGWLRRRCIAAAIATVVLALLSFPPLLGISCCRLPGVIILFVMSGWRRTGEEILPQPARRGERTDASAAAAPAKQNSIVMVVQKTENFGFRLLVSWW